MEDDQFDHFTVGYEPGVKIGDQWMIEDLHWERAAIPSKPMVLQVAFPVAIPKLCKGLKSGSHPRFHELYSQLPSFDDTSCPLLCCSVVMIALSVIYNPALMVSGTRCWVRSIK